MKNKSKDKKKALSVEQFAALLALRSVPPRDRKRLKEELKELRSALKEARVDLRRIRDPRLRRLALKRLLDAYRREQFALIKKYLRKNR